MLFKLGLNNHVFQTTFKSCAQPRLRQKWHYEHPKCSGKGILQGLLYTWQAHDFETVKRCAEKHGEKARTLGWNCCSPHCSTQSWKCIRGRQMIKQRLSQRNPNQERPSPCLGIQQINHHVFQPPYLSIWKILSASIGIAAAAKQPTINTSCCQSNLLANESPSVQPSSNGYWWPERLCGRPVRVRARAQALPRPCAAKASRAPRSSWAPKMHPPHQLRHTESQHTQKIRIHHKNPYTP